MALPVTTRFSSGKRGRQSFKLHGKRQMSVAGSWSCVRTRATGKYWGLKLWVKIKFWWPMTIERRPCANIMRIWSLKTWRHISERERTQSTHAFYVNVSAVWSNMINNLVLVCFESFLCSLNTYWIPLPTRIFSYPASSLCSTLVCCRQLIAPDLFVVLKRRLTGQDGQFFA